MEAEKENTHQRYKHFNKSKQNNMAWGTQEQKGDALILGVNTIANILTTRIANNEENKKQLINAKSNGVTQEEYDALYEEYDYFSGLVENLLGDAELGCKFKRTEEIFLDVMKIFLLDLEHDNREIINNFTKAIDSEEFINSHELALKKREERLDKEYSEKMKEYEIEMADYRNKLQEHKSKSFFSKIFADEPVQPEKPSRRE